VVPLLEEILKSEGFSLNPSKTRLMQNSSRQLVTGLVVNKKPGIPREELRQLRAILHQARTSGLEKQNRTGKADFTAWLRGKIAYLAMVDPEKGRKFLNELEALEPSGSM
jgi:hypothetical protein